MNEEVGVHVEIETLTNGEDVFRMENWTRLIVSGQVRLPRRPHNFPFPVRVVTGVWCGINLVLTLCTVDTDKTFQETSSDMSVVV